MKGESTIKKIHIEILRIVAIFLVMFNHTSTSGFQYYTTLDFSVSYIVCALCSVFCKVAVPIFLMISGALILNKDYSFKELLIKIIRILIVLLVISLFYYLQSIQLRQFDIVLFFKTLYSDQIIVPLWYLYAYISFLIMVPFLRILVKNMTEQHYIYLLSIAIIFGIGREIFSAFTGLWTNSNLAILLINSIIYYPLLGYYIENIIDMSLIKKRQIIVSIVILLVSGYISVILNYNQIQQTRNILDQSYLATCSYIQAPIIYIIIKWISGNVNNFNNHFILSKFIYLIGSATFGLYLFDEFLRTIIYWKIFTIISPFINIIFACFISIICCILLGTPIILIIKKIPLLKKLI